MLPTRAQDIVTGNTAAAGRVALDVGVVCPQAAGNLGVASSQVLGAAEEYARSKCARGEIERRCQDAGVVFQPMIFESFGGVSAEAERVLKSLNKAVAVNSDASVEVVATQFWRRVGVDILRSNCRAFHMRLMGTEGGEVGCGPFGAAVPLQMPAGI